MKWYDAVECDNTVEDPLVADSEDLKEWDEWDFVEGKLVENWNETVWFQAKKLKNDGDPDQQKQVFENKRDNRCEQFMHILDVIGDPRNQSTNGIACEIIYG